MPSGEATATAARTCSFRPATRTWKKSSRFWLKMARKRTRSRSASLGSSAIASTRSSKSSLDSSRLMYLGLTGKRTGEASGSGWAPIATGRTLQAQSGALAMTCVKHPKGLWRAIARLCRVARRSRKTHCRGRRARPRKGQGGCSAQRGDDGREKDLKLGGHGQKKHEDEEPNQDPDQGRLDH